MTDPQPGWNKGAGYWARPEHVHYDEKAWAIAACAARA